MDVPNDESAQTRTGGNISTHTVSGRGIAIGAGAQASHEEHHHYGDDAYDVRGLLKPYPGLCAFTYEDRERYAGRAHQVRAAVAALTTPGQQRVLLFVTGASGSGKSSFAQAGLLPALEQHYQQRQKTVRHTVLRPSQYPLAMLADALQQPGMPHTNLDADTFVPFIQTHTPDQGVNVLILDQFEELFTRSVPDQRDAVFAILEHLPPFTEIHTHLIATLRSDYLPELHERQRLWECWQENNIDLRVMGQAELKQAIQRPLQKHPGATNKRFEAALLDKLAADASADAAYLPLLQVTLEKLWDDGWLKLEAYANLTDAIRQRAEQVYSYADGDTSRSQEEQAMIMQIFLDLVEVSLDNDARRDVRRRRTLSELTREQPQRAALAHALVDARLLSTGLEMRDGARVEVVDIIHESLIANWERLRSAIAAQRELLQQRARFELALAEWLANGQHEPYLLTGVRLAEAEALNDHGDVALRSPEAQDLLQCSVARQEEIQREEARRLRRWLLRVAGVAALAVIAAVAAVWSGLDAQRNAAEARNRAVVAGAQAALGREQPDTALALALAAVDVPRPLPQAEQVLVDAASAAAVQQFQGHLAGVRSVALSPDGRTALSGADDTSLRVWDVASGQEIRRLDGHAAAITSVAVSPDGQQAVSGSQDQTVRLWDVAGGEELRVFTGHTAAVLSVAISPDGRSILSGAADGTVLLWDAASGQEMRRMQGHAGVVYSVAFSPDGQTIVSGGQDRTVKLWDAGDGALRATLTGHDGAVLSVAISPDGSSIVSGSGDSRMILWDRDSRSERRRFTGHTEAVWSVTFSPDGQSVVSGSRDRTVRLWDVRDGATLRRFTGHSDAVWSVAFSHAGQTILSGSEDTTLRLWQVTNWQELRRFSDHTETVESVAFSPDGRLALSGSRDRMLCLWEVSGTEQAACIEQADEILSVAFSPDGRHAFAGLRDGRLSLWDGRSEHDPDLMSQHTDAIRSIAVSPDGQTVLFGAEDGRLCLVQVAGAQPPHCWQAHAGVVFSVAFSPDATRLLSGSSDRTLRLWDRTSGQELQVFRGHAQGIWSVAFRPDGQAVLSASEDATLRLWDTASGQELRRFEGHQEEARSVDFSPDGRFVVSGAADKTVRLWDAASGQELRRLDGHREDVTSVAFSPDGRQLLSGSVDTTVRLWRVDPLAEIKTWIRTHRYVPMLTEAECAFYHLACGTRSDE